MKISEILTRHPACTTPEATLMQAALQMKILDVGMLPVCAAGNLIGTVTDRDIVVRAMAQQLNPQTTRVREIMTEDMIWCFEDQEVTEAARLMEEWQIRRLPVVNRQNRLVGIITLSDLAVRTDTDHLAVEVLEHVSVPAALCEPQDLVA